VPDIWDMVQGPLPSMIANPARYQTGDPASIEQLFLGLVMTGLAIQASGSTRCASGSEHQFSHLWEMRGLEHRGELVSHGVKVGFGAIFSAALYERLLAHDWSTFALDAAVAKWPAWQQIEATIRAMDDSPALIERALIECQAKYIERPVLRERLATLRDTWPDLAARLRAQLMSPDMLRGHLIAARAPTTPAEIGLTHAEVRASYVVARRIRRRYTIFDLVDEMGVFDQLVNEIYQPGGFWGHAATTSR
jgi:glycerol-1-phosphate dehydrogenase [NAD(P)+]